MKNKKVRDNDIDIARKQLGVAIKTKYSDRETGIDILGLIMIADIGLFFWAALSLNWIPMVGSLVFLGIIIWGLSK